MRCSIERRASGKWTVRYSFLSGDGRRLFRRVTLNGATRKDAEGLAARIAADLSRGTYADAGLLTIAHLCDEWLTEKRAHLSPTTVERYEGIVNLHIKPILGATRLRDLKRRHISNTLLEWQTRPRHDSRKGGLTSTSVRHNFTTLSTVLHFAVQSGYLAANPCKILSRRRVQRKRLSRFRLMSCVFLLKRRTLRWPLRFSLMSARDCVEANCWGCAGPTSHWTTRCCAFDKH